MAVGTGATVTVAGPAGTRIVAAEEVQADGTSITTVEGLAGEDGTLHPLQEAFVEHHGLQCGFCTPGMLMSALHLLDTEPDPDRERIREEMSGGICRCTGYQGIVDAVEASAAVLRGDTEPFRSVISADGT